MSDFDPDAYLEGSQSTPAAFDPDAHLDSAQAKSAPAASTYDPTEGMSKTSLALAGAGKAFVDTGRGIKQIATLIGRKMGIESDQDLARVQAEVDAAKSQDAPLMRTTAGTLGNVGGQAALLAVAPEGLGGAATGSALLAGAQPVATGESRGANVVGGALGGAAGYGAGKLVGKIVQPVSTTLSEAAQSAVARLRGEGIPLDLAQQTGSKGAQTLKNVVADNPLVGHSELPEQQSKAFTRAVLRRIGADSDTADSGTMGDAKARIGGVFDDIASRNPIQFDDVLQHELTQAHAGASSELSEAQMRPINAQINTILDKAADNGGAIDGKAYQNIKTSLDRISQGSDQAVGHWARQVRTALDNGLQRSVSPEDLSALTQARSQYRAMKQIEGAIGDNDQISPAKLANAIDTKSNAAQTIYGKGDQDLYRLAVAGKNVISNTKTPNSGTAQRLAGMALLGGAGGEGLNALTGGEHTGRDVGLGAGIALGAPYAARAALENPKAVNFLAGLANNKAAAAASKTVTRAGTGAGFHVGEQQLGN